MALPPKPILNVYSRPRSSISTRRPAATARSATSIAAMPLPITQMSCSLPDEAITDQAKVADSRNWTNEVSLERDLSMREITRAAASADRSGAVSPANSRHASLWRDPRATHVLRREAPADLRCPPTPWAAYGSAPATPMAQPMSARKRRRSALGRFIVLIRSIDVRLTLHETRREGPLNTVDPATRKKVELPSAQTGMNTGFFAKTADSLIRDELVPQRGL